MLFGDWQFASAQVVVLDSITREPVSFASVYDITEPGTGTTADINGVFKIASYAEGHLIRIGSIGYITQILTYSNTLKVILLSPDSQELNEVSITANDAPAIEVIKKVLLNKDINSLKNYPYYQCRSYVKSTLSFEGDTDSVSLNMGKEKVTFPRMIMISESIVEKQYQRPGKEYEKVLQSSFSGLKEPYFAFTPNDMHSMDPYETVIRIYGKDFISPVTQLSWLKYHFNLSRIYQEGNDSMYVIDFWPRISGSNALRGFVIISDQQWAIQKMRLQNEGGELYPVIIQQEFTKESGKWFPIKMVTEVKYPFPIPAIPQNLIFNITAKFDQVKYDSVSIAANKANTTEFIDSKDLFNKSLLDSIRGKNLPIVERNAYEFGNELFNNSAMGYFLGNMESFLRLKIPVGPISINLKDVFRHNKFEKYRWGMGLSTNSKFSSRYELGGYMGYGVGDGLLKYGIYGSVYFDRIKTRSVSISYIHDLGFNELFSFRNNYYNKFFSDYFYSEQKVALSTNLFLNPFDINAAVSYSKIRPFYTYSLSQNGEELKAPYENNVFSLSIKYEKARQYNFFNTFYTIRNIDYPVIQLNFRMGFKALGRGDFKYQAVSLNLNKYFKQNVMGQSLVTLEVGKIFGVAPLFDLFNAPASRLSRLTLQVPNAFQTMPANTYWSNQYFNYFLYHLFGQLYSIKFSRPAPFIAWNGGWASLTSPSLHQGIKLKQYPQGYQEAGVGLNNIIRLKFRNFIGIGINFGMYHQIFEPIEPLSWSTVVYKVGIGFSY